MNVILPLLLVLIVVFLFVGICLMIVSAVPSKEELELWDDLDELELKVEHSKKDRENQRKLDLYWKEEFKKRKEESKKHWIEWRVIE